MEIFQKILAISEYMNFSTQYVRKSTSDLLSPEPPEGNVEFDFVFPNRMYLLSFKELFLHRNISRIMKPLEMW